ncbi:hypothetical protein VNO80_25706 [Phaseolus coccineus]|uniref:Uncharacterized protein n=1 Tax=Phaseolus coccineus TaxID=3886 RepID=A0AAN9LUP3_PHACN
MPVPPPWRGARIELDSPSTNDFNKLIESVATGGRVEVSMSPLLLLGGDLHLGRRVLIGLSPSKEELIGVVLVDDLLRGSIEMMCRAREHELAKASRNLKQSLVANTSYEEKLVREVAEREIAEGRVATLECRLAEREVEVNRVWLKRPRMPGMLG